MGAPVVPTEDGACALPWEVDAWLTHLVVERGRSPHTLAAYSADLRRWMVWLAPRGVAVTDASVEDVEEFAGSLRASELAPATVIRVMGTIGGLYAHLLAEGLVAEDPTDGVEVGRRPLAVPKALSEDEVVRILDSAAAQVEVAGASPTPRAVALRDLALLEFLYSTGARVSEACGLGFGDLDFDAGFVRLFGKRSKERVVPVGGPAERAMRTWLDVGRPELLSAATRRADADAVFLGVRGRRLSRQAAFEVIRARAREAGVAATVSPHVLRHSCATHLLDNGADIRTVAEMLGHASVSTTQIYTKVATERLFESYRAAHPRAAARPTGHPA